MSQTRINHNIRAETVRVVTMEHKQLGIIPLKEAIGLATKYGLDLIEISASANPPVCMMAEYGKWIYQQEKQHKEQHTPKLKEISLTIRIEPNDLNTKLGHAKDFLDKGHVVRFTVELFGRDQAFKPRAFEIAQKIISELATHSKPSQMPKLLGRKLSFCLNPKH